MKIMGCSVRTLKNPKSIVVTCAQFKRDTNSVAKSREKDSQSYSQDLRNLIDIVRSCTTAVMRIVALCHIQAWINGCWSTHSDLIFVSNAAHLRSCFSLSLLSRGEPLSQPSVRLQRLLWHVFSWETRGRPRQRSCLK
jgi:hypothetical protein